MKFPNQNPAELSPMLNELGSILVKYLGFAPPIMALIVTDGKQAQTFFSGSQETLSRQECQRLLDEALTQHKQATQRGTGKIFVEARHHGH